MMKGSTDEGCHSPQIRIHENIKLFAGLSNKTLDKNLIFVSHFLMALSQFRLEETSFYLHRQ